MHSKERLIEDIQEHNRSAHREWLELFDVDALRRYLEHLRWTLEPRGRHSFWVRQGDSPAMMTRQPAD